MTQLIDRRALEALLREYETTYARARALERAARGKRNQLRKLADLVWRRLEPLCNARPAPRTPTPGASPRAHRAVENEAECIHCGASENLCTDHIIPQSHGGPDDWWNIQKLCSTCNARKSDRVCPDSIRTLIANLEEAGLL